MKSVLDAVQAFHTFGKPVIVRFEDLVVAVGPPGAVEWVEAVPEPPPPAGTIIH